MSGTAITAMTKEGTQQIDPARKIPGMAPGGSQPIVPHVVSFQAMAWSGARVYRPSDEALRDSLENARYMRNDACVMECVEQRQRSTALLGWHIEVGDEDDPEQAQLRDAVTGLLERIPYFTKYRECLLGAIWYGRYAVENRYRWQWIDGRKYVGVARWRPIHGDKLVWKFFPGGIGDDDGNGSRLDDERLGIRIGGGEMGKLDGRWRRQHQDRIEPTDWGLAYFLQPWERDLLVLHQHIIEDGEYEDPFSAGRIHGMGIRSRIYWTWYQKQEALAWLMEFLERSGFGIEIWYYPYGNAEAEEKTRKAAQERIGQGRNIILVPRPIDAAMAYGVERIEPGMSGAQALKDILTEYFGHQIKRYILGQTLTTEAHATGLGSNLAAIHLDTYVQIIRYDALNLQETLTRQLVEPLVRFNWPELARRVQVRLVIETDTPDVESKLQAWRMAWEMGLRLREKDVMELIGAATPGEEDRVLENPQIRLARQAAQSPNGERAASMQQGPQGSVSSGMPGMPGFHRMYGVQPPNAAGSAPAFSYGRGQAATERYSADGPREGDTKQENGRQYVLRGGRWHRVDREEEASEQAKQPPQGQTTAPEPTHGDIASLVEEVLAGTRPPAGQRKLWTTYRRIEEDEATRIKQATGLDLQGYRHTIDDSAVRHILNRHGPAASLGEGEIPVRKEDFALIPQITGDPDEIGHAGKSHIGLDVVLFRKRINGMIFVVSEVWTGRKELALKTMWKTRTTAQE